MTPLFVVFAVGGYNSHSSGKSIGNGSTRIFINIFGDQDGVASSKTYSNVETINIILEGEVQHTDYFNPELPYHDFIVEARVNAALGDEQLKEYIYNSPYVTKKEGNKVYIKLKNNENN